MSLGAIFLCESDSCGELFFSPTFDFFSRCNILYNAKIQLVVVRVTANKVNLVVDSEHVTVRRCHTTEKKQHMRLV